MYINDIKLAPMLEPIRQIVNSHYIAGVFYDCLFAKNDVYLQRPVLTEKLLKGKTMENSQRSPLHLLWLDKYNQALENMQKSKQKGKGILIEVAAQHPLKEGQYPAEEFSTRLDLGVKLYQELSARDEVKFYIPGSRHQENGKADLVSLSTAGKNYLISKGIPAENIFADDANDDIMGTKGVYNSTDECFVSCSLFKKYNFAELHLVCSPNQMMRKMLCYISFGCFPNIHTASTDKMYHNPINEIFECIPKVLENNQAAEDVTRNSRRVG